MSLKKTVKRKEFKNKRLNTDICSRSYFFLTRAPWRQLKASLLEHPANTTMQ